MKKGFTLIELLAVVIVLAVIALIATPIVLDVVEDTKNSANKSSANMVLSAAKNYYAESLLDKSKKAKMDGKTNLFYELQIENKPKEGTVYINEEGNVALVLILNNKCYVKAYNTEIEEYSKEAEECDLAQAIDETVPTVSLELVGGEIGNNEWYTTAPFVKVTVTDDVSGFSSYKWCVGLDCEPNTYEYENESSKTFTDSALTQICVKGIDKAGNESIKKVCSNEIKVDTTKPEISGIGDITVQVNEEVDLVTGVEVSDNLSEVEGTFTTNPENVDTSKTGTTEVKYRVADKAGNTKEVTRKVIVSADAPTITYSVVEGVINEQGWANKDFYVTIDVKDNTGHGIKEFRVCTATTDTCDPTNGSIIENGTTATRLISTESNNNRICVQATDKTEQTSEVICSDAYKLDKTNPTAGTINITGTKGENDWYISDVIIEVIDGSDELSGHTSTVSDITSITENTTGTKVTVTTIDKAGNTSTNEYTIKVDKDTPTISLTKLPTLIPHGVSYELSNYVTPNYTTSNGSYECSTTNTSKLNLGIQELTCTITAGSGKSSVETLNVAVVNSNYVKNASDEKIMTIYTTSQRDYHKKTSGIALSASIHYSSTEWYGPLFVSTDANATDYYTTNDHESNATSDYTFDYLGMKWYVSRGGAYHLPIAITGVESTIYYLSPTSYDNEIEAAKDLIDKTLESAEAPTISLTLSSTSGTTYIGGSDLTATINGTNYGNLYCRSSNKDIATCSISGNTLTIKPGTTAGNTIIIVSGTNKGAIATYESTIKNDTTEPTVSLDGVPESVTKGDSYALPTSYTTSQLTGGSVECKIGNTVYTNTSILPTGTYEVTCTATTGAGVSKTVSKNIAVTYDAYQITNLITDGSFENGNIVFEGESDYDENHTVSIVTDKQRTGNNSLKLVPTDSTKTECYINTPTIYNFNPTHKYYFALWYTSDAPIQLYYWNASWESNKVIFSKTFSATETWGKASILAENSELQEITNMMLRIDNNNSKLYKEAYYDDVIFIDLTETFGEGNEPNQEWCDKHINWFDGTTTIYK